VRTALRPVPESPPRVLGLIRVSKERDGMVSPEVQRVAIADYAAHRGYQVVGWLEGSTSRGPGLGLRGGHASSRPSARSRPVPSTSSWCGSSPGSPGTGCGGRQRSTGSRPPAAGSSPPPSRSTPPRPPAGSPGACSPSSRRSRPNGSARCGRKSTSGGSGQGSRRQGSRSTATATTVPSSCISRTRCRGRCWPISTAIRGGGVGVPARAVAQQSRAPHHRRGNLV
jgi:hypothetical protein